MKTSIVVVYHNRTKNLDYWLSIWSRVKSPDVTLTIIHNFEIAVSAVRDQVEAAGAKFISRWDVGYDIGAFQDVCRKRLKGFDYNYDFLLWFTDDCFPMRADFVDSFTRPLLDPKTGLACLEISNQIRRHVRTTGFCLKRETAENIKFLVDPVKTKEDCYRFEHRAVGFTLYEQILAQGLKVHQIAALRESPAWDAGGGGHGWVNRRVEFETTWGLMVKGSKVIVIAPAYQRFPEIVSSMILQTYHNWELWLVHNGPAPNGYPRFDDSRVKFVEGRERGNSDFGHPVREEYIQKIKEGRIKGDYVVVTNDDNYHAPFFLEKLVKALDEDQTAPGAYCSAMVHNYAGFPGSGHAMDNGHAVDGYNIIQIKPERGFIDCAAVMLRAKVAAAVGWPDYSHSSDWNYLNRAAQQNGGWAKFKIVPGVLLVHN